MSGGANAVAWLEAELQRVQQLAQAAPGHRWQDSAGDRPGELWVIDEDAHLLEADETTARHVVAHDPAAVLRRVAADRQILALHSEPHSCPPGPLSLWWDGAPCRTVLLLAEGYGWTEEAG